jgi:hypothetical protein
MKLLAHDTLAVKGSNARKQHQTLPRSSDVYAISTSLSITLESSLAGLSANMFFISGVQFLKAESCDIDAPANGT